MVSLEIVEPPVTSAPLAPLDPRVHRVQQGRLVPPEILVQLVRPAQVVSLVNQVLQDNQGRQGQLVLLEPQEPRVAQDLQDKLVLKDLKDSLVLREFQGSKDQQVTRGRTGRVEPRASQGNKDQQDH